MKKPIYAKAGQSANSFFDMLLELYELQIDKVMQLYETMLTRHTTMVTGPSGGGKSVVIAALQEAQKTSFGLPTSIYPINQKARPRGFYSPDFYPVISVRETLPGNFSILPEYTLYNLKSVYDTFYSI